MRFSPHGHRTHRSIWRDPRTLLVFLAALSLLLLAAQFILLPALRRVYARVYARLISLRKLATDETAGAVAPPAPSETTTQVDESEEYVKEGLERSWVSKNGGLVVLSWGLLRLVGLITLVATTSVSIGLAHGAQEKKVLICLTSFYVNTFLLSSGPKAQN